MIGMEFDQPVKEIRSRLIHEQKVFTGASGTNVIRLLPPLCLSKEEADEFLARLKKYSVNNQHPYKESEKVKIPATFARIFTFYLYLCQKQTK